MRALGASDRKISAKYRFLSQIYPLYTPQMGILRFRKVWSFLRLSKTNIPPLTSNMKKLTKNRISPRDLLNMFLGQIWLLKPIWALRKSQNHILRFIWRFRKIDDFRGIWLKLDFCDFESSLNLTTVLSFSFPSNI